MPVFGTVASRFNDDGVTALWQAMKPRLAALGVPLAAGTLAPVATRQSTPQQPIVPGSRARYLADIADTVRDYKRRAGAEAALAREIQQLRASAAMLAADKPRRARAAEAASHLADERERRLDPGARELLADWPALVAAYAEDELVVHVRDRESRASLAYTTLSGSRLRKVALPGFADHGDLLKWLRLDHLPGRFPFTAGTFAVKREGEDPTRMSPARATPSAPTPASSCCRPACPPSACRPRRFGHALGHDPARRPDIYGKVGNSGVSIATLDDMKVLYGGFDLTDPATSVSMTINGPAPTILAMFLATAIDQKLDAHRLDTARRRRPTKREASPPPSTSRSAAPCRPTS